MHDPYKLPAPAPLTEAQKERARYIALEAARARHARRDRWHRRLQALRRGLRM